MALRFRLPDGVSRAIERRAFAAGCIPALLVAGLVASGQSGPTEPAPKLSFDAASIKQRVVGDRNFMVGIEISPGRLVDECANLEALISFAYNLLGVTPVEGLPPWAKATPGGPDNYMVEATMPADVTRDQARQMMQTLLADRFKLAVHWERRNAPVYDLVVGAGGFKARPIAPDAPPVYGRSLGSCPEDDPKCHQVPGAPGTIAGLADILAPFVGRPVIDKSGVAGNYDRMLQWAGDTTIGSSLPSLPALLREKYGLELKADTGEVPVLVVDRAERPTPN